MCAVMIFVKILKSVLEKIMNFYVKSCYNIGEVKFSPTLWIRGAFYARKRQRDRDDGRRLQACG